MADVSLRQERGSKRRPMLAICNSRLKKRRRRREEWRRREEKKVTVQKRLLVTRSEARGAFRRVDGCGGLGGGGCACLAYRGAPPNPGDLGGGHRLTGTRSLGWRSYLSCLALSAGGYSGYSQGPYFIGWPGPGLLYLHQLIDTASHGIYLVGRFRRQETVPRPLR